MIRYIGNCQICERDQKVIGGLMVHHGYKRPGHGTIDGDCPGVGEPPYEISCDALKRYEVDLLRRVDQDKAYLVKLNDGQVDTIDWYSNYTRKYGTHVRSAMSDFDWTNAVRSKRAHVETNITRNQHEIERVHRRIARWTHAPLRTVNETESVEREAKAVRQKAVADKRAARAAKEAANQARRDELAARKKSTIEEFASKFRAFAAALGSSPHTDTVIKQDARKLYRKLGQAKYRNIWLFDLKCDDEFVRLDLARREPGRSGVHYDRQW